jgi:hypothetical protein
LAFDLHSISAMSLGRTSEDLEFKAILPFSLCHTKQSV